MEIEVSTAWIETGPDLGVEAKTIVSKRPILFLQGRRCRDPAIPVPLDHGEHPLQEVAEVVGKIAVEALGEVLPGEIPV